MRQRRSVYISHSAYISHSRIAACAPPAAATELVQKHLVRAVL
jgi:hypothetical protein